ncbi:MAG: AAA-like domain protein [Synergistetes bacterium ADurb.BinA166]|nr:MAG: AAA-like domain protein [Synergistetes bacterium ADurb.BinA166]
MSGAPPGGERLAFLFEPREAAGVFRFPAAGDALPAGLEVRGWRLQPAPANLPRDGVVLGRSLGHGLPEREIRLGSDDRLRHLYSIGQTGTGKSSLLRSMLLSDIEEGQGVCLIDPHGDLFGEILENIPPERADDVVVVDPTDTGWPVGINLLEYDVEDQRHFLVQELLGILRRLIEGEYGGSSSNVTGPLFWQHVRMNLLLAMSRPSDPGTLVEFHAIFNNPSYWRRWIPLEASDPQLEFWATHVLERTDYLRPGSDAFSLGAYISSKFDPFVFDPMLRLLFGQKRSTIRLDRIMDEGKILLVNLAKGLLTETNARFLGMVLLAKLQAATMARARRRKKDRRPFFVYVDEFQSLATSSFVGLLSEARKFGVGMVLANQFLTQIENNQIVKSILGNAGTLVCFRLGQPDAEAMEPRLAPAFSASDLQNLPNFHACVTLLARGEALRPFTMRTLFRGAENPDGDSIRSDIVARSRAKYARPRKEVEEEIERSLRTS